MRRKPDRGIDRDRRDRHHQRRVGDRADAADAGLDRFERFRIGRKPQHRAFAFEIGRRRRADIDVFRARHGDEFREDIVHQRLAVRAVVAEKIDHVAERENDAAGRFQVAVKFGDLALLLRGDRALLGVGELGKDRVDPVQQDLELLARRPVHHLEQERVRDRRVQVLGQSKGFRLMAVDREMLRDIARKARADGEEAVAALQRRAGFHLEHGLQKSPVDRELVADMREHHLELAGAFVAFRRLRLEMRELVGRQLLLQEARNDELELAKVRVLAGQELGDRGIDQGAARLPVALQRRRQPPVDETGQVGRLSGVEIESFFVSHGRASQDMSCLPRSQTLAMGNLRSSTDLNESPRLRFARNPQKPQSEEQGGLPGTGRRANESPRIEGSKE